MDTTVFSVDLEEFVCIIAKTRTASNAKIATHWYELAITLYNGDYLDNLYYDWLLTESQRLSQKYIFIQRIMTYLFPLYQRYTHGLELLQ